MVCIANRATRSVAADHGIGRKRAPHPQHGELQAIGGPSRGCWWPRPRTWYGSTWIMCAGSRAGCRCWPLRARVRTPGTGLRVGRAGRGFLELRLQPRNLPSVSPGLSVPLGWFRSRLRLIRNSGTKWSRSVKESLARGRHRSQRRPCHWARRTSSKERCWGESAEHTDPPNPGLW